MTWNSRPAAASYMSRVLCGEPLQDPKDGPPGQGVFSRKRRAGRVRPRELSVGSESDWA